MSTDAVFGIIILCLALSLLIYMVIRSRRIISRISARRLTSIREILKDLDDGR